MTDKKSFTAFAQAALIVAFSSFIHLFGIEKALIAIAFAVLCLRQKDASASSRKMAIIAILIAVVYILLLAGFIYFNLPLLKNLISSGMSSI